MKLDPLDILFSEYIRRRAISRVGGCERCLHGKIDYKQLQCSHFIGRARRSVRWDEDNAAGLCAGCHMYLTAHPTEHVQWFMKSLGEERADFLLARNRERQKPDTEAITLYLRAKIAELNRNEGEPMILCKIGLHKWGKWAVHPFWGNKITRQCSRCFRHQDGRI